MNFRPYKVVALGQRIGACKTRAGAIRRARRLWARGLAPEGVRVLFVMDGERLLDFEIMPLTGELDHAPAGARDWDMSISDNPSETRTPTPFIGVVSDSMKN